MKTAKVWGLTPTEWYREPRWSRATMLETCEAENTIGYWLVEDQPKIK